MQFRLMTSTLALIGLFTLAGSGFAAKGGATDTSTLVFVGGTPILRIRTGWVGKSAQQRAQEVQLRLNHALSVGPVKPRDITVGQLQGDWVVLFKGHRFLTADAQTARLENSAPQALAEKWAARMRKILPELTRPHGTAK